MCVNESVMLGGVQLKVEIELFTFDEIEANLKGKRIKGKMGFYGGIKKSIVISDLWKTYNCLNYQMYKELKQVNNLTFKEVETGTFVKGSHGVLLRVVSIVLLFFLMHFDFYFAELYFGIVNMKRSAV
ncbi:hypothetical protein CEXT_142211 [Caerostris extrusa]|uniref:Uncharacterized protein n=1 Tax=Caerostris extrusa TaxID=172846 RepID=A0AAV4M8I0_CAEEX|nr:hypothetical protein CEXT_142211 [Caerostris extrusa]